MGKLLAKNDVAMTTTKDQYELHKMKETLCYVAADPAAESVGCGPRGSGGGVGRPGGGRVGISSPNHAWEK